MVKSKKSFAEILQSMDAARDRKLLKKLPGWAGLDVSVPTSLALEQCSSSATAAYKAALALEWSGGKVGTVCDITGGLGSDTSAFAAVAGKVVYLERNPELVDAARHNCSLLGLDNVEFHCMEVDRSSELPMCDMVYADPARRDVSGRKLFRLEDCSPDIGDLAPVLLGYAGRLMVKLSPMADVSAVLAGFPGMVEEVQIVCSGGEVKELLCLLAAGASFRGIRVVELGQGGCRQTFSFMPEEENRACAALASSVVPGQLLLEPSAGMLKSGAFKLPCLRFGISKLDPSTHLYVAESASPDTGQKPALPPEALFSRFEIVQVLPLNAESFRTLKESCPQADVSARNIRMDSENLAKRLGCRPGGGMHVFGCRTSCCGNLLMVTRRLVRNMNEG